MKSASLLALLVASTLNLLAAAPVLAAGTAQHHPPDDSPPLGLTAELDGVPTLAPMSLPTPYQLDWQRRLLAFQRTFEATLGYDEALPKIDPIETGAISGLR